MSFNLAVILSETTQASPDRPVVAFHLAVVIRRPAMDLLESELLAYCRQRLAAYKCPRVFQFRAELPKNSLGKVLKDELTLS